MRVWAGVVRLWAGGGTAATELRHAHCVAHSHDVHCDLVLQIALELRATYLHRTQKIHKRSSHHYINLRKRLIKIQLEETLRGLNEYSEAVPGCVATVGASVSMCVGGWCASRSASRRTIIALRRTQTTASWSCVEVESHSAGSAVPPKQ
jgi:hypothetical protein